MNNYIETSFSVGSTIKQAMEELNSFKHPAKGEFNGTMLNSDMTLDEAYQLVTGKTYAENIAEQKKWREDYEKEKQDHKKNVPNLVEKWNKEGEKILDPEYLDLWHECVPIRLNDLYQGMELSACLSLVQALNDGESFDMVSKILKEQGHSGMSYGLVCNMVKSFSKRGADFVASLS